MIRLRSAIPALLLPVLLLLSWPAGVRAEEKPADVHGAKEKSAGKTPEKKPNKVSSLSKEDREVVKNLDLLEMMALLKDMDVLTETEDKK